MNLAVIGGRTYNNYSELESVVDSIVLGFGVTTIVSGGADGADTLAEKYAKERGLNTIIHIPNWEKHGHAAGLIRNKDIIGDSEIVVAFWDKKTRGTENSINLAKSQNKITMIVYY